MGLFSPEQFAEFDRQLASKARRKPRVRNRAPMSGAERVRAHVAASNEIGDIPRIRHRRVRESCRLDLLKFGLTYFGKSAILRHAPSDFIVRAYILKLQEVILHGGQFVVQFPRGAGKTTWMMIALVWALLYGHKRYSVIVAASGKLAKKFLKNCMRMIWTSPMIVADFPAIAIPFMKIGGVAQKAASQTYHGRPTFIEPGVESVKFPMLRDADGNPLDSGCGATFVAVGKGAAVKGQNDMGARPDIVLLDDPQTRKDAGSASATQDIDEYIHGDILGLGGHDAATISCLVTITPIAPGDIATRLVSPVLHPEWITVVQPLVMDWPKDHERLVAEFLEAYRADAARKDTARTTSKQYYLDHVADFAAMKMLDDEAFDHDNEVDAKHHALNLIGKAGIKAFRAEYQLRVDDVGGAKTLEAETVAKNVNGYRRGTLPPGCVGAVAFCDVNIREGANLSWVILGFAKGRVASIVDYGRFPEYGALVPEGTNPTRRDQIVAAAIRTVVDQMAARRLVRPGKTPVSLNALCFDRGWSASVIARTLAVVRKTKPLPFALLCSLGRGWNNFAAGEKKVKRWGDHVVARESMLGDYLEIHADYWREISQGGFFSPPLTAGSTSVFGKDPAEHFATQFANEIAAERLEMRYTDPASKKEAWKFTHADANHWGDALSGCFALGSWFGFYEAVNANVDGAVMQGLDLFTYSAETAPKEEAVPELTEPDPWDADEDGLPEQKQQPSVSAQRVKTLQRRRPSKSGFFRGGYW